MRIALISDIHGNDYAFEQVLAEIADLGVDEVVCLGDIASLGPEPGEALDRLKELDCLCILGNHDEFLFEPELIHQYTKAPPVVAAVDWCREQLSPDAIAYLRTFVFRHDRRVEARELSLFHGTPQSHCASLLPTTPGSQIDQMLEGSSPDIIASGHTHIQMLRQHLGRLLINPGSVGMPFAEHVDGGVPRVLPHAEYAILTVTKETMAVDLRRIDLSVATLRKRASAFDWPLREYLLSQY